MMSDNHESTDTTLLVGFLMGLVGSLAGVVAATFTDRRYARSSALGAVVNLSILSALVMVDALIPGSVFGLVTLSASGTAAGPSFLGPLLLPLAAGTLLVAVGVGTALILAPRGISSPSESGKPWRLPDLGNLLRDLPNGFVVASLVALGVAALGAVGFALSNRSPNARPPAHPPVRTVAGAAMQPRPAAPEAEETTPVSCQVDVLGVQGWVAERDPQSGLTSSRTLLSSDPEMVFEASAATGQGTLYGWGFDPAPLSWSDGACSGMVQLVARPGGIFRVQIASTPFEGPFEVTAWRRHDSGGGPRADHPRLRR